MSSVQRFANEIVETRRLALGHATTPQLTSSSIDGGNLEIRDGDNVLVGIIGVGEDGGLVIENREGPPPPMPSMPSVVADAGILRVNWNGSFADDGDAATLATSDCECVEIHASMEEGFVPDGAATLGGAYATLDGGSFALGPLAEAGTYYVRLVAKSKAHKYSEPSETVEVELVTASVDEALTNAWLTGEAAQITADGKNGIYRGPDEPVEDPDQPFKDGDIWFEMTDDGKSIPNIWDEDSGAWVANDDYRQSEIEKVQQELREDLDAIVVDGSGTTNYYQGTPPDESSSPPPKEGDLWFDSSDSNKPYIYQDGEWITVRDSFSKAGAAERFASVRDKHSLDNWWSNVPGFALDSSVKPTVPSGASGDATIKIALQGSFDPAGNWVLDETGVSPNGLPIGIESQIYVKSSGGAPTGNFVFGLQMPGGNPTSAPVPLDVVSGGGPFAGATHQLSVSATAKSYAETYGTIVERMWFSIEITLPAAAAGDFIAFEVLSASYLVPSTGIADKAITTEKIATGAITAESGIIGSINAGTITVGEMNGARIKAGTVDADTVLVESSIGSTLIKDGAILTEHIKVGAITAESGIIGSIDANVITVGKIMGNQLDADAINGKTITGATIRTASSGSRVELTQNGLKQYNSLGAVVADMSLGSFTVNGGSITGATIQTAPSGSRVQLNSSGLRQYNSSGKLVTEMAEGAIALNGDFAVKDGTISLFGNESNSQQRTTVRLGRNSSGRPSLAATSPNTIGESRITFDSSLLGGGISIYSPYKNETRNIYGQMVLTSTGAQLGVMAPGSSGASVQTTESAVRLFGGGADLSLDGGTYNYVRSTTVLNTTVPSNFPSVRIAPSGYLGAEGSARRFKMDEQEIETSSYADALLSVPHKSWVLKDQQKQYEEYLEFRDGVPIGPVPGGLGDAPQEPPRRDIGMVAEDLVDAGLEQFVQFDQFGQTLGIAYDRIGVAVIPIVRDLRDRIVELEAQLAAV